MGILGAFRRAIGRAVKSEPTPPRPVRYFERYPGLGPLRWWDKIGPESYRCRVCKHETFTWRGMQTHCRQFGHRRPSLT